MKKLIFILMLMPLGMMAQSYQIATDDTISADKYYWIKLDQNMAWRFKISWTYNNGTSTTVLPMTKTTASGDVSNYSGISAYTFSGTTGNVSFIDQQGAVDNYLGIYVDVETAKRIALNIWVYLTPKQ